MLVFTAVVFGQLPDQLPIHWDVNGQINGYAEKAIGALILPGIVLLLVGVRVITRQIDPKKAAYLEFEGTYYLIINVAVLLMGVLQILMLGTALGWEISMVRLVMIGSGLLIAIIGNELGRVQPNWFVGIRTPWTLSDPEVWRETHRTAGRLFFVGGLLMSISALLLSMPATAVVFFAVLTVISLGTVFYSYRQYQVRHTA
jgi:uncharacterized membrane protein